MLICGTVKAKTIKCQQEEKFIGIAELSNNLTKLTPCSEYCDWFA